MQEERGGRKKSKGEESNRSTKRGEKRGRKRRSVWGIRVYEEKGERRGKIGVKVVS